MSEALIERTKLIGVVQKNLALAGVSNLQVTAQSGGSLSERTCKKEERPRNFRRQFNRKLYNKVFLQRIKASDEKGGKLKSLPSVRKATSKLSNMDARHLPPTTNEILKQLKTRKLTPKNYQGRLMLKINQKEDTRYFDLHTERLPDGLCEEIFSQRNLSEAPDIKLQKVNSFLKNLPHVELKLDEFYKKISL